VREIERENVEIVVIDSHCKRYATKLQQSFNRAATALRFWRWLDRNQVSH
jgi:hypothetical protein